VSDNSKRQIPKNNIAPHDKEGRVDEQRAMAAPSLSTSQSSAESDSQFSRCAIDELAADPFDDELLEFQAYLKPVETGSGRLKLLFVPCLIHPV